LAGNYNQWTTSEIEVYQILTWINKTITFNEFVNLSNIKPFKISQNNRDLCLFFKNNFI
jgi:hypothetical protein